VFDNMDNPERCLDNAPDTWLSGELKCSKGRSFAWRITEIEAPGYEN